MPSLHSDTVLQGATLQDFRGKRVYLIIPYDSILNNNK